MATASLRKFLATVCVIEHVILSPPIAFGVGKQGFTEDWALVEIDPSKVNSTNSVGSAIDLGITISVDEFTAWMYPHPTNPSSFKYSIARLHILHGTISDQEMLKPSARTIDYLHDPCIMVVKRGAGSELTVGRLNTIRLCTRVYFNGKLSEMSKEVTVLPRNSKSGAFSVGSDSGSGVVNGIGRYASELTGGAGSSAASDCSYITSIHFLRAHGTLWY